MNESFNNHGGNLSDVDIQREMANGRIFIAPFDSKQLQPSGYNLTPTNFFYSTKKRKFLLLHKNEEESYVIIDRSDTVLTITRESIVISPTLTGAFYSKVKIVSEGFGHVSTTLDPNWEGQLLISINNPTNHKLKFSIKKNVYGNEIYNSFVTLEFTYLNTPSLKIPDNPPWRLDILDTAIEKNISILKRNKIIILKELVEQLKSKKNNNINFLIFQHLTKSEKEQWREIQILNDETEYNQEQTAFIDSKKKKYLRLIQEDFYINSIENIRLVNEFIDRKQSYLPLRHLIFTFIKRYGYTIVGIVIVIALSAFLMNAGWMKLLPGENKQLSMTGMIIIYIIYPMLKSFIDRWDRD
ncbi:MAG: hypothetical protein Q4D45_00645 [Lachnospiraceae bacterium]|nr:hypothetical protein [Lachnospiraceae bacterium]